MDKKPKRPSGAASNKEELDAASARKLELEAKLIEDQLTPAGRRRETLKAVAGVSGLVIALVTVIGGLLTILNWLVQENHNRDLRIQERMDRSLSLLSETRPTQRTAAISSLQSFIATSDDTRNSQVLVSIANALPLEEDGTVRNAMLSLFEDIDAKITGKQALNVALKSLAHNSRGLMRASDLWNKNPPFGFYRIAETIKQGAALEAIARAITVLLRKGARVEDLSEIYLPDSDLSDLDLTGINFDFSILALTDFSNAILTKASFNGANLEHVNFVRSDLRSARLSDQRKLGHKQPVDSYIEKQFESSSKNLAMISLPDFSCADLRNAVFSNHALFGIWRNEVPTNIHPVNFAGSNLANADMTNIYFYVLKVDGDEELPIKAVEKSGSRLGVAELSSQTGEPNVDLSQYFGAIYELEPNAPLKENTLLFSTSLQEIRMSLQRSNWEAAKLPRAIKDLLAKPSTPGQKQQNKTVSGLSCVPRAPW
jgi:uncharacterized protein YjbI with pentapeptide repeats